MSAALGSLCLTLVTTTAIASRGYEPVGARLSDALELYVHPKYLLTAAACTGIQRRAERRGKSLPEMLGSALAHQAANYETIYAHALAAWEAHMQSLRYPSTRK